MEILLEEFYKQDLHSAHYTERRYQLEADISYQLTGITLSGKTSIIKNYLLQHKKSHYLYIDCSDLRIDTEALNQTLYRFCNQNEITILALDNYDPQIRLPKVKQLIIASNHYHDFKELTHLKVYPLNYEGFLAFEQRFDDTALSHFFQLGGFPFMHRVPSEERTVYLQKHLQYKLDDVSFDLLHLSSQFISQKVSAFTLYERLKQQRKISKDRLYRQFESLIDDEYIYMLAKYQAPKATKKLYHCDIAIKNVLTSQKHFGRLFENMLYLEMIKGGFEVYYDDDINFYIPQQDRIIIPQPFGNDETLFKLVEKLEAFIITHSVKRVEVVTMSAEASLHHPFVEVAMEPFNVWALTEGEDEESTLF